MLSDFFYPDLTACLTQSLQHAASQGNWDPPRWTGRLSPESASLVNSCFPSPKPPESATAVPFSSLKGLWNGVAAWCLPGCLGNTSMELKAYIADVHLCTHPRHTQVHAHLCTGWIPTCFRVLHWALGPDMLSIFLYLECSFRLFSGQPTTSLQGLLITALP